MRRTTGSPGTRGSRTGRTWSTTRGFSRRRRCWRGGSGERPLRRVPHATRDGSPVPREERQAGSAHARLGVRPVPVDARIGGPFVSTETGGEPGSTREARDDGAEAREETGRIGEMGAAEGRRAGRIDGLDTWDNRGGHRAESSGTR